MSYDFATTITASFGRGGHTNFEALEREDELMLIDKACTLRCAQEQI